MLAILVFATALILPIAWIISEFQSKPVVRLLLGLLSIVSVAFCSVLVSGLLTTLNYNAEYGATTSELIEASLAAINDGHVIESSMPGGIWTIDITRVTRTGQGIRTWPRRRRARSAVMRSHDLVACLREPVPAAR